MRRLTGTILGSFLLALAGCGGGATGGTDDLRAAGLLRPVANAAALETSLKSGLTAMSSAEQLTLAIDLAATSGAGNFTGTYTQEKNVDEFDAVRYDGTHLFVAPRRYHHCCFLLPAASTDGATNTGTEPKRSIRILATDPDGVTAEQQGAIPLEEGISVQGIYLAGEHLFALTGGSLYGSFGALWTDIAIWAPEQLGYRLYDVSDASAPVIEVDAKIDGVFVESRRIGNTVYIVSRYTPRIEGLNYYVTTTEEQIRNEQLLANVTLDEMLPKITVNGTTRPLVAPERCYVTTADDGVGYPVITSITAVAIDDPTSFSTTCYNEDAYGAYVSENALYLTEARPDVAASRDTTRIHKFRLSGTAVNYRGSADIDGSVWRGGQADFRMNETGGDLRVFSSQFDWSNEDFVDHQLYILRENAALPELDIVSSLPNASRPDEIGKPNEMLYGVRFLEDRAYAVTFRQIDPLYALDLSNPADPFIAGELEITGFSDFLHPINDALLLGLGTGANGGVKLELFDVSNIAQPLSRGSSTLGGRGSYSEAVYDRHAFTYQANVGAPDRIALPALLLDADGSYSFDQAGLYLFEVRDKETPSLASLATVGAVVPPEGGLPVLYPAGRNRSFIHNDTVYYVSDEDVWAASWLSPSVVNGPF